MRPSSFYVGFRIDVAEPPVAKSKKKQKKIENRKKNPHRKKPRHQWVHRGEAGHSMMLAVSNARFGASPIRIKVIDTYMRQGEVPSAENVRT